MQQLMGWGKNDYFNFISKYFLLSVIVILAFLEKATDVPDLV